MKIQQPRGRAIPEWQRVAQVLARERIEEPTRPVLVPHHRDLDGVVICLTGTHLRNLVSGIALLGDSRQLIHGQRHARSFYDDRLG